MSSWACGASPPRRGRGEGGRRPARGEVQRRFRALVRAAHPDHGGDRATAADRLAELSEARRILLAG